MIRITFASSPTLIELFEQKGARIIEAVVTRLNVMLIRLQAHIVNDKLSGQVLKRRSGKLAASIRVVPAEIEGSVISGEVQGAGGPAWYGRVWESPTEGKWPLVERMIVPRNMRALAFVLNGQKIIVRRVIQPAVGAKPFMSPALNEMREEIVAEIQKAFNEAAR